MGHATLHRPIEVNRAWYRLLSIREGRCYRSRLAEHIIDGTATTIMLGETRATNRLKGDDNNNAFVGWGNVPTSTMMPINMKDIDSPAGCDPGNWARGSASSRSTGMGPTSALATAR